MGENIHNQQGINFQNIPKAYIAQWKKKKKERKNMCRRPKETFSQR